MQACIVCHNNKMPTGMKRSPIADAQERASVSGVHLVMADIEPGVSYVWYAPYLLIPMATDNDTALGILTRFFNRAREVYA